MEEYNALVRMGKEKLWRADMVGKAEQGTSMLRDLKGLFKVLPSDPWQVRDLWCQGFELAEDIQAGLACIQAHVDYLTGIDPSL
jgi:hypothetical protein